MLKITINFCGKSTLDVEPLDQIATVKQKICDQKGIQPENQRLLFAGTELEDAKTITDYGIENNSRIDLVPLYPKCKLSKNDRQPVQDFVGFHSNCEGWMMESFIANGSLIEERDKWKEFSYKLTSDAVQSKKQNRLLITEVEELKKCCRELMEKVEKTVEENAKFRDENAKYRDENPNYRDENARRLEKSIEEVEATLMDHINKCEPIIDKLSKLLLEKK